MRKEAGIVELDLEEGPEEERRRRGQRSSSLTGARGGTEGVGQEEEEGPEEDGRLGPGRRRRARQGRRPGSAASG